MKRYLFIVLLLLFSAASKAQGEASIWYFGQNAGLKFMPDGTVIPLSDGQIITNEGCSSISDINGNLLLYTDGKTVWDRNHLIMPNGVNLFGDPSSTQSGIIIPKPNSSTIYYIFTVDEPHHENAAVYPNGFTGDYVELASLNVPLGDDGFNNGLNYSVVDLTVIGANGSIGDVVSRNNPLITYDTNALGEEIKYKCSEKITAISSPNNNSLWVITHFINKFYAFKVDETGVNMNPVISTVGANIGIAGYRRNSIGYLKASPDGNKLAIAHQQNGNQAGGTAFATGRIELFNFDIASGFVSNPFFILPNVQPYGVEFSSSSEKLYTTYREGFEPNMSLVQFDLLVPDVLASKTVIYNSSPLLLGIQLALNSKIYCSTNSDILGVINNPDANGLLCNYVHQGQQLALGTTSRQGLPPFITSFFFTPAIQLENACVGQSTAFQFNMSQNITSATWDFGDGSFSTELSPNHAYNAAGNYTVTVTVIGTNGSGINTRDIVIHPPPILNTTIINFKQCDDDNDGYSAFNLNETRSLLVNDTSGLIFSFYQTLVEAEAAQNAINEITNYTNQTVSSEALFARIENANGCFAIAQINLQVSTTTIPSSFQKVFTACDDLVSGSITDGIGVFDFSSVTPEIQALYPPSQLLDITYYRNLSDALAELNAITLISSYANIDYPQLQNIYVRVDSQVNNECLGLGHHITLNVEQPPVVQPQVINQCDDDQDGILAFNTSNLESTLLNGLSNVTVTYTDENGVILPSPLPNPFVTGSKTIDVIVTNDFGKRCEYATTVTFVVDDLPEVFPLPLNLTSLCDDEISPELQNGVVTFDTSGWEETILSGQTGLITFYFDENNNVLPSPLPNPFVSITQTIRVEVINPINTECQTVFYLPLIVNPLPLIELTGDELICTDDLRFTRTIDAGLLNSSLQNNYSYTWFLNNTILNSETSYTLNVSEEGVYMVEVQNQYGCISTRTITVTASNAATIEDIIIKDLTENNSIEVIVSGLGDYLYNLNDGTYQESAVFSNLASGIYNVGIKDVKGCASTFKTVYIIGTPKYFTPNGDGYNDFWNISFLGPTLTLKVSIFDRFGKFLKQFDPRDGGWDGTYNTQNVPATDYWYIIEFLEGRVVKGHFSLLR